MSESTQYVVYNVIQQKGGLRRAEGAGSQLRSLFPQGLNLPNSESRSNSQPTQSAFNSTSGALNSGHHANINYNNQMNHSPNSNQWPSTPAGQTPSGQNTYGGNANSASAGHSNHHHGNNSHHSEFQENSSVTAEFSQGRIPKGEIIGSFTESPENRRTAKWPQLQKALELCRQRKATLLIMELGTLSNNESFTHLLLKSGIAFHCIDQPFVNQPILEALSKHAEVQRKLHGKLIREGLKLTSAKSGNPNAAEVISKVNKPKIDTAIVFAFLLQPIIQDYRRKGYSQRQMVKTLNEEGFTAPEGGKWVLSQLQKVLDRVRLNEIATELKPTVEDLIAKGQSYSTIAETLNTKALPPIKQPAWDDGQVKRLHDRIQQIQDIMSVNRFVLELLPLLHEYRRLDMSTTDILMEFQKVGFGIRQNAEVLVA